MEHNSQWNWFLTPSTTPTDPTFSPTALQTPRTSTHFNDAFSPYVQNGNQFPNSEPVRSRRQYSQDSTHVPRDDSGAIQQHNQLQAKVGQHHTFVKPQQPFSNIQHSAAVQTPPPTRNPSEKRRAPRPHSIMFGTPSSMDQMLADSNGFGDHSHMHMLAQSTSHPVLPMAMDFAQFDINASTGSQDDTYWNMSNSMNLDNMSQNGLADPFTYQSHDNNLNQHTGPTNEQIQFLATTPQLFTPAQPSPIQRAPIVPSNASKPLPPIPSEDQHQMMSNGGHVDPTNIYSSPNCMPPPALPHALVPSNQPAPHADSLSPERIPQQAFPSAAASLATSRLSFDAKENGSRPPSSGGLKSGVRRANTVENRRPHSMYGSIESLTRSNTTSSIQRRNSPLKRYNRNSTTSLASISEFATPSLPRSRTSVVLTVDSKGRARTQTRNDSSPTRAMMARYPNLYDTDSDSDSDDTPATSNRHSFCAPSSVERPSRAEKINSALASLEGLHLPRSSSSTSNRVTPSKAAVAAAAQLRRQSSVKKNSLHHRRSTVASSAGSFADGDAMDTGSDTDTAGGDAAAALRKAMERRDQHRQSAAARQEARSSRPQSRASRPQSMYAPRTNSIFEMDSHPSHALPMHALSPQKSSPMKPSGNLADAMSSITRCICHLPIAEGQLMIQCNSCTMWLHTACLGIPPTNIPPTYFCSFCMASNMAQHGQMGWQTTAAF